MKPSNTNTLSSPPPPTPPPAPYCVIGSSVGVGVGQLGYEVRLKQLNDQILTKFLYKDTLSRAQITLFISSFTTTSSGQKNQEVT